MEFLELLKLVSAIAAFVSGVWIIVSKVAAASHKLDTIGEKLDLISDRFDKHEDKQDLKFNDLESQIGNARKNEIQNTSLIAEQGRALDRHENEIRLLRLKQEPGF